MKPDLVLLDMGLPGIDGYEVARRLRAGAKTRHTVLIALTGWGQEKDRQRAMDAGFDAHIVKPVGLELLMETVNRYCNKRVRISSSGAWHHPAFLQ
jgi:CheY-like chemotaxis protein